MMVYEATLLSQAYDKGIALLNKLKPIQGDDYVQPYIDELEAKKTTP
jgi:hypothetical protein